MTKSEKCTSDKKSLTALNCLVCVLSVTNICRFYAENEVRRDLF